MLEFNIKQSHLKLLSERIHLLKYQCKLRKALSSSKSTSQHESSGEALDQDFSVLFTIHVRAHLIVPQNHLCSPCTRQSQPSPVKHHRKLDVSNPWVLKFILFFSAMFLIRFRQLMKLFCPWIWLQKQVVFFFSFFFLQASDLFDLKKNALRAHICINLELEFGRIQDEEVFIPARLEKKRFREGSLHWYRKKYREDQLPS